MNLYWVAHNMLAQKITETTDQSRICYLFNINRIHLKIVCQRTRMTHQQQVSRFESCSYWTCCWQMVSSTACIHAGNRHFDHKWCCV